MADTTISMNSSWRVFFAAITLAFHAALIVWITVWGNPANTLHQSALSWSYFTGILILASIGIGQYSDAILQIFKK